MGSADWVPPAYANPLLYPDVTTRQNRYHESQELLGGYRFWAYPLVEDITTNRDRLYDTRYFLGRFTHQPDDWYALPESSEPSRTGQTTWSRPPTNSCNCCPCRISKGRSWPKKNPASGGETQASVGAENNFKINERMKKCSRSPKVWLSKRWLDFARS